jgi:NAD(P)-dependent dehydrogenase (short-subunit alcohol dehydrogenase family)
MVDGEGTGSGERAGGDPGGTLLRMRSVQRVDKFRGSVAIVTGGGSGIGAALVRAYAAEGAAVVVADLDGDAAERVAAEVDGAAAAKLDVTDTEAFAELAGRVAAEHGRIDQLVNNAGIAFGGEFTDAPLESWRRLFEVNVLGVVNGVNAVVPHMRARRRGHILNTASIAGLGPLPGIAAYAASKHAVVGLSTSLRLELARDGIGVTTLCPGVIETPLLDAPSLTPGMNARRYLGSLVRGRLGSADALAAAAVRGVRRNKAIVLYPASARAIAMTGRLSPALLRFLMSQELKKERARA